MNILLVKPRPKLETIRAVHGLVFLEPLELGYLAASVPDGHDVQVLDLRRAGHPERVFERKLSVKPDVIGISGYTHEVTEVLALARIVRRTLPAAKVIVGGHHATVFPGAYQQGSIDAVVRGEGCLPFRALIEALAHGRSLAGVPNVVLPGAPLDPANDELPEYPELDRIPNPRRDLWDPKSYWCIWPSEDHPKGQTIFPPVALVRSSFGCRMNCSFCVTPRLSRHRHMTRSPDRVADEIAQLQAGHVYFCDDETFINTEHAERLAAAIEARGIRKKYFAWARTTTVVNSPALFQKWRQIGLDAVFLGLEATTDEELAHIHKNATVQDGKHAHAILREMGIAVQAGFMVRPEFTRADFERLRQAIQSLPPAQVTLTVYTPSPGSPAWALAHKEFVCDPFALHDCMHPLTPAALPLRDFYREFASLIWMGAAKNPVSQPHNRTRIPLRDVFRVWRAAKRHVNAVKRAYRDFPRELW